MTPTPKAASVVAGAQLLKTPLENRTEPSHNMVATLATRGVLEQYPPGALEKVSLATGVSESDLATLTVSDATPVLYHAISEYCALSPAQLSKHQPLHVSSDDPYEPTSLSDIESEDLEAAKLLRRRLAAISHLGRSNRLMPGKGSGKKRAPVPKYKLGLGHVSITWPPPPNLTAAAIRSEKKKERATKRRKLNEKNIKEDLPPLEEDGSLDDVDQHAKTEENSTEPVSPEEQSEIHVIHYVVGDPCLESHGRFTTHSVFLLATAEGPQALQRFTKEVIKWRIDKDHRDGGLGKYALHRFKSDGCGSGYWKDEGLKHARSPESVVLREGTLEAILDDIKNFLDPATKSWYIRHGLPHRRSLLFYGPPGTGKTSTIGVMASTFGLNCCFLSMTDSKFSNQMLADALSLIPPNALLVLEDVDSLFGEDRKKEQGACVTFSGLLNALDGVISAEGAITVMTTNFIDKLDKALIRGGRVDRRFHFQTPTIDQIQRLFLTFYPKAGKEMAKKFAERIFARPEGSEGRSIATVQQLFIHHRADPAEKCLKGIDEYYDQHFPNGTGSKNTLYT